MCHADVNMVTWQHHRLPRVAHIWNFLVIPWTSRIVPHGSLYSSYSDVAWRVGSLYDDVALTWKWMEWSNRRLSHGPIKGFHVAGGKSPMTARIRFLKTNMD